MREVDFYYDIVCPFAYLGSTQIERIAAAAGARVAYRPFLLGGLLKAIGSGPDAMAEMPDAKRRHTLLDMHRWAEHLGVPFRLPGGHPRRTVLPMRAILAAGDARVPATQALFRAYWVDGLDVAEGAVVSSVLSAAGLDGAELVARTEDPAVKLALRDLTDEAVRRGVFGAPTFFVGDELFWGQDRLDFVARALDAA